MIELVQIMKSYGNQDVLKEISFHLKEPGVIGLLGQNGAGKSTLMNMITGYLSPSQGKVLIYNIDMFENSKKAKSYIGYLPEKPPLYTDLSVLQYLSFIYDIKKCSLNKKNHIDEICSQLGISEVKNRIIKNLSKGYQQRIGIAQAMVGDPPILILDEPTIGLDPKQIIDIRNLIMNLGKTKLILISSHMLSEIQAVCERILLLHEGNLIAMGTTEELQQKISSDNKLVIGIRGSGVNLDKCLSELLRLAHVEEIPSKNPVEKHYLISNDLKEDIRAKVSCIVVSSEVELIDMHQLVFSLEEAYIELIGGAG